MTPSRPKRAPPGGPSSMLGLALVLVAAMPFRLAAQAADPVAGTGTPAGLTEWQPSSLVPGVSYMPLLGAPDRPGAYVYRVRARDGLRIPLHWHTRTMHLTVLSGTLMMVMGESADSGRAEPHGPGSFLAIPAGMRHLEWFAGETVVHVETQGPFETVFANPDDDPRRRARP